MLSDHAFSPTGRTKLITEALVFAIVNTWLRFFNYFVAAPEQLSSGIQPQPSPETVSWGLMTCTISEPLLDHVLRIVLRFRLKLLENRTGWIEDPIATSRGCRSDCEALLGRWFCSSWCTADSYWVTVVEAELNVLHWRSGRDRT